MVTPINGSVLVELADNLEYVQTPDKQYSSRTTGKVVNIPKENKDHHFLLGKKVYFSEYKDGIRVGENMAVIEIEDIRAYEN